MTAIRYLFVVFVTLGFAFSSYQWRSEARKRLAAEVRYDRECGDVVFGKAMPQGAWSACGYCDSLVVVDPKSMDTLGYFTFRDSVWHTSYRPGPKDSVDAKISLPKLTLGTDAGFDWVNAVARPVTHTINGKPVKRFLVEAVFNGGIYQVFAPTPKAAFQAMDSVSLEVRGRPCCLMPKG